MNKYYIPIKSDCLTDYFNKAIMLPANYWDTRPKDLQTNFNNAILLSCNKWVESSDCSIEIVLTEEEIKKLNKIHDNFFLSFFPVPISRIKRIYFNDKDLMETILWNINSGTAFISKNIINIEDKNSIQYCSISELSNHNIRNEQDSELENKINQFDSILGGLAFMKISGKPFMNFSENYFATLSYFNKMIEEQKNAAEKEKSIKFSNKYLELFSSGNNEWSKWKKYIFSNFKEEEIKQLAEKENLKIQESIAGLLKYDNIPTSNHIYDLVVLANYGKSRRKSTEDLISDIYKGMIPIEKTEDIAFIFGLNQKYSTLRNKYKTPQKEIFVKFKMESKLDYYTIESIYQFVFNSNRNNYLFNYLDNWIPSLTQKEKHKGFITYKILDTIVIAQKKRTPLEIFFQDFSNPICSSIYKSIKAWLPPFAKADEKEAISFFEELLKNSFTIAIESIQKEIEKESEINFSEEKKDISDSYEKEKQLLTEENNKLKEKISELEKTIENFKNNITIKSEKNKECSFATGKTNSVAGPTVESFGNYKKKSLRELKEIAKQKGIKNYKKLKKQELINAIIKHCSQNELFLKS